MKKKLYLANPYGFSKHTKKLIPEFISIFNSLNIEVYEPFERTKNLINKGKGWAYDVAHSNYDDIKNSDGMFAIVNGNPPDEGVMVEVGIALAFQKEIFLFRDDFRNCSDTDEYPLNLMIFLGLDKEMWFKNYFEAIEEILSDKKNLIKWAKN